MAGWGVAVWGVDLWGSDSAPTVTPVSPVHLQTSFPNNGSIELIIDDDTSVDLSTVMIRLDLGDGYVTAVEGYGSPQFKSGWDGPGSSITAYGNGYRIIIDPTSSLPSGSISVEVAASDDAGNPL